MLNKQSGNMYEHVTHTWNPIKGRCPHECTYCYMKNFKVGPLRLDEKDLNTDLGEGKIIFVGSSTDMWAKEVPDEWIKRVLEKCNEAAKNIYLFQSKNPVRFIDFVGKFPEDSELGTTIETDCYTSEISKAPDVIGRSMVLSGFSAICRTFVTIEPILDFDLDGLVHLIAVGNPSYVNIGADSKGNNLREPSSEKLNQLINDLLQFTEVRKKPNLDRLLKK